MGPLPAALALFLLAGAALVSACGAPQSTDGAGDDDDDGATTPTPEPTPTPDTSDHLTADATWTGDTLVPAPLTIDPGVTLTVAAGSTVRASAGAKLLVEGTLVVEAGATSVFQGDAGASWGGIVARPGGVVTARDIEIRGATTGFTAEAGAGLSRLVNVEFAQSTAPIRIAASTKLCRASLSEGSGSSQVTGGTATISDSDLFGSGGDTVVFSGGEVVLQHVLLGAQSHCLVHGGGTGAMLTVEKTVLVDAAYAFMLSGLSSATVRDSRIEMGTLTSGNSSSATTLDARENWWGGAGGYPGTAPAGWDVSDPVTSATDPRVVDAGPRPDGAGCESDATF